MRNYEVPNVYAQKSISAESIGPFKLPIITSQLTPHHNSPNKLL